MGLLAEQAKKRHRRLAQLEMLVQALQKEIADLKARVPVENHYHYHGQQPNWQSPPYWGPTCTTGTTAGTKIAPTTGAPPSVPNPVISGVAQSGAAFLTGMTCAVDPRTVCTADIGKNSFTESTKPNDPVNLPVTQAMAQVHLPDHEIPYQFRVPVHADTASY